jgi:lipooligosaccharide transport system permease protein
MHTLAALGYHLAVYRRTWRSNVFSSFALPVMFLVAMGVSVGRHIDGRPGAIGMPYLDFIGPGLLASTALAVAVSEATWPAFSAFKWVRSYHAMRASPLTTGAILRGHLLYLILRVLLVTVAFLLVLLPFGVLHSWWALAAPVPAVLVGLALAMPAFGLAAKVSSDMYFAVLFRLLVIPMSLFAGVYFPVDGLPWAARALAYASPLWHGVELCRAATLGTPTAWGVPVHVSILLAWIAVGYPLSVRSYTRKLED